MRGAPRCANLVWIDLVVRGLEELGRDGPDDWAEPIAEAARLDGTISGTLMYRSQKASLVKYLTGTVTICD
jgi:hypothetical protein